MAKRKPMAALNLDLAVLDPMTNNQSRAFASKKHLVLEGAAGTGKSYCSIYLGLEDISDGKYQSMTIIRSCVPTRDIGFLPGNTEEKTAVYEAPYQEICNSLFGRGDAYQILKKKDIINFITTSFIRGITLDNTVIIVDEVQNMTFQELDSIITRVGANCRIIFCGDYNQSDLKGNGLKDFLKILNAMGDFDTISFTKEDIVRSGLVKSYIINKMNLQDEGRIKQ
jgi:phosphate starvation-inducible PhoH-like protein